MSAFIVNNDTISRVIAWTLKEAEVNSYFKRVFMKGLPKSIAESKNLHKDLFIEMMNLNIAAVNHRYSEKTQGVSTIKNAKPVEAVDDVQTLKHLSCWIYQCTEGEVPKSELYMVFDDFVRKCILEKIVLNSKEYENAKWG